MLKFAALLQTLAAVIFSIFLVTLIYIFNKPDISDLISAYNKSKTAR